MTLGRIVTLAAILENKLLTFYQHLVGRPAALVDSLLTDKTTKPISPSFYRAKASD